MNYFQKRLLLFSFIAFVFLSIGYSQRYSKIPLTIMGFTGRTTRSQVVNQLKLWNIDYTPLFDNSIPELAFEKNEFGGLGKNDLVIRNIDYCGISWLWFAFHFTSSGILAKIECKADVAPSKYSDACRILYGGYPFFFRENEIYYFHGINDNEVIVNGVDVQCISIWFH